MKIISDFLRTQMRTGADITKLDLMPDVENDTLDECAGCHSSEPNVKEA
ncbi:hypothetical protein [Pseudomonas sp. BNK-15]